MLSGAGRIGTRRPPPLPAGVLLRQDAIAGKPCVALTATDPSVLGTRPWLQPHMDAGEVRAARRFAAGQVAIAADNPRTWADVSAALLAAGIGPGDLPRFPELMHGPTDDEVLDELGSGLEPRGATGVAVGDLAAVDAPGWLLTSHDAQPAGPQPTADIVTSI